ncbi:hypothetical protein GCM10007885_26450 [Methylobacterium gnaphalii]|nr:hypothetical protein GCM10007885_26450 [Methylobacterium gnaphalii]
MWPSLPDVDLGEVGSSIEALSERWKAYRSRQISRWISDHDDMWLGDFESYISDGETGVRAISEAMVLSGRTKFQKILDLPCGGGRVTRLLKNFFPESQLWIGEIVDPLREDVSREFAARELIFNPDFSNVPTEKFDLVFSGSLLTHFDKDMYSNAINFYIEILNKGGIAVLSTHGRSDATRIFNSQEFPTVVSNYKKHRKFAKNIPDIIEHSLDPQRAKDDFSTGRFGYFASPHFSDIYKQSYGGSFVAPSWVMAIIQARSDCLILGYKERSYGKSQDIITLLKL